MDHWRRGHKQMCKKIHRTGNAEQYYADKKYKEALAVAVEACAGEKPSLSLYKLGLTRRRRFWNENRREEISFKRNSTASGRK